jgi:CHAD domain-containing protein
MRFRSGESLAAAINRVNAEQFDIALGIATAAPDERALAVHSTRKAIKRLRSVLRLVRGAIPEKRYDADNQMLKLIAAELGSVRDAWVMAETLSRLLPDDPATAEPTAPLIARLQTRYRAESQAILGNGAHMASIIEQLENIHNRSALWTVLADGDTAIPHSFSSIAPGLERVYKRGSRGMQTAVASPTNTLLHNWRKRAKYLRHQVEALNLLNPEEMLLQEVRLATLTDLLGDDHDLAVLTNRLEDDHALTAGIDIEHVEHAIVARRRQLQRQATELGSVVYAPTSEEFLEQLHLMWHDGETF